MIKTSSIPLVEAYRPKSFNDIVLDKTNRKLLNNIIETGHFPHILFYGPPGTGKTTSAIKIIEEYQKKNNQTNKELIIHLNASDERGIDVIRTQISQFVNSKTMFNTGMKFVILDEVDYMTKNAQQALRYLLQNFNNNVRICLICNYISRIDEGLQNEFLKLRFNQLPEEDIIKFLKHISDSEKLHFDDNTLKLIQKVYKSDIRSMINFMQTNQDSIITNINVIDDTIWEQLYCLVKLNINKNSFKIVENISRQFNIDKKTIIKDFFNYLIRNYEELNIPQFFSLVENIIHFEDCDVSIYVNYSLSKLSKLLQEL
jgi:DNA polymerase III delta prime subunit